MTQGLITCTKEKPGCITASWMMRAVSFGWPEKARATKLAPEASAITSGWKGRIPVPPGASALSHSGSVVGEGWPLVMP